MGNAMPKEAGLWLSCHGPCGLPAVQAVRVTLTPRLRNPFNRVRLRFYCLHRACRNSRCIQLSRFTRTEGVWQNPKQACHPRGFAASGRHARQTTAQPSMCALRRYCTRRARDRNIGGNSVQALLRTNGLLPHSESRAACFGTEGAHLTLIRKLGGSRDRACRPLKAGFRPKPCCKRKGDEYRPIAQATPYILLSRRMTFFSL